MSDTESTSESDHDDLIIDDEGPDQKCVRPDLHFHQFVVRLTESNWFNGFIMITIILNSLTMALETDPGLKTRFLLVFEVLDEVFLGIYTLEFIMKIYAEPIRYFYSSYNLFDLFVLLISYVQVILTNIGGGRTNLAALRTLRALRALRTLRTVSFVKGLQVLVTALIDTIRNSVVNVVLLLLLLMFLFSIIGYYIFGYKDSETESDKEHWGDLGTAMLSLFNYVTVEGWTDLQAELDALNIKGSRLYTIVFIFLGHFIFTNVFIGLVIMNIHEATENYRREQEIEREQIVQRKKEYMIQRQHNEVRQMLEKQNRGEYKDFYDMVKEFQSTLRHDDYVISVDIATNLTWLETTITTLDHMENTMYRLQMLHFEMANLLSMVMEKKLKERYGM